MNAAERRRRLAALLPAVMFVADVARAGESRRDLAPVAAAAVAGGVAIVQIRAPGVPHDDLLALGARLRDAVDGRALIFVNGDPRAAEALGAGGLHVPERALAALPDREAMLVSRAVHDIAGARAAEAAGADLLVFGSVFVTPSHPDGTAAGLDALAETCAAVRVPVLAIGGVRADNAQSCVAAGAAGVAVIGALLDAPEPRATARALVAAVRSGAPVR